MDMCPFADKIVKHHGCVQKPLYSRSQIDWLFFSADIALYYSLKHEQIAKDHLCRERLQCPNSKPDIGLSPLAAQSPRLDTSTFPIWF